MGSYAWACKAEIYNAQKKGSHEWLRYMFIIHITMSHAWLKWEKWRTDMSGQQTEATEYRSAPKKTSLPKNFGTSSRGRSSRIRSRAVGWCHCRSCCCRGPSHCRTRRDRKLRQIPGRDGSSCRWRNLISFYFEASFKNMLAPAHPPPAPTASSSSHASLPRTGLHLHGGPPTAMRFPAAQPNMNQNIY